MPVEGLRRRLVVPTVLISLCMAVVTGPGQSARTGFTDPTRRDLADDVAEALALWLPDELSARGVPGAAAVVVDRNGVVSQETWGTTGLPASKPVTADTIFCIRSVSKSVTALAVLFAVQEGLVDLDIPITEYLEDFTINSRFEKNPELQITLRHMLSHWASFAHDPPFGIDLEQRDYFRAYIDRISDTWLRFPVGYRHEYSNYGYDLAGHILEQRSGMKFADYLQEKIFEPLDMTDSTFDLHVAEQSSKRAVGHRRTSEMSVHFPEIASGGMYSSIRDMGKLAMFHLNGAVIDGRRLLREDLMEQYHSIQFAQGDQRTGYTLGLIREPVGSTVSLYHEGGGRGYASHMMLYPELGVGAVLLTNLEYHGLTGVSGRKVMNAPILAEFAVDVSDDTTIEEHGQIPTDAPAVEAVLGRYGDSPSISVGIDNGQLGLRDEGGVFDPLVLFEDDGELLGRLSGTMEVRFLRPFRGRPGSMMLVNRKVANRNNHYRDYNDSPDDPVGPNKPEWGAYIGTYDVTWEDEAESTVEVEVRNGYLYFRDGKSEEHEPGLFFLYDGNVIDFRSEPPTFANQKIRRKLEYVDKDEEETSR